MRQSEQQLEGAAPSALEAEDHLQLQKHQEEPVASAAFHQVVQVAVGASADSLCRTFFLLSQ